MSSPHGNLNEELTTDALPSPSRSMNEKNIRNERDQYQDSSDKSSQVEEEINTNSNNEYGRKLKKNNIRKISPATTASAVIINVNNSKSVHVGDTHVHNYNGLEKQKKTEIIETAAIRSLKMNAKLLTRDDLLFVASHIDSSWKDVARDLHFSEGQISQFISDHHQSGTKEVIFQVLLDWYQNTPDEATVSNLSTILWKNNQKDVVKRWSLKKQ
ncbi:unnamed protein product [Phaedon cochleariae]|uniref:Death domain-containing protein n=1 Tax=Phaedon cochleariae TaxID=80249 RepID=A0A9N9X1V1_PHACE|nr:unnamed protein product [Phaedon cochleariae]